MHFVKSLPATEAARLIAERDGLAALAAAAVLRTPTFLAFDTTATEARLTLEHLELRPLDAAAGARLGTALAQLHRVTGEDYGWLTDNFIGATPQLNTPHASWPHFFGERRLRPQLALAAKNGMDAVLLKKGEAVIERIGGLFISYRPQPSLLHGDLWSGNAGQLPDGTPVVFDPAVYYGDREIDLAMSELFGGFPTSFYAAYRAAWPLDSGYEARKLLYNLYHILNHYNLFGGAYLGQAQRMIEGLLTALKR